MPGCPSRDTLLELVSEGRSGPELRAHLEDCERCRELAARLHTVLRLGAMLAEESFTEETAAALPAGMAERIWHNVNVALRPPAVAGGVGRIRSMTVMITDLAGSGEFAEKYGAVAALEKRWRHNDLLKPLIEAHRGTLVRVIGDALLVTFEQAADAAKCAMAIQRRLAEHNAGEELDAEDRQIHVRVGIHYSKAIEQAGGMDLAGRAVSVAARVEAGGGKETDQILVSDAVLSRLLLRPGEFFTEPAGVAEAKGVGGVRLHRLLWKEGDLADAAGRPTALAAKTDEGLARRVEQEEGVRAVHGVFVDTASQRGYVLPVWVQVSPAAVHDVRPRGACDRVMDAAARRAVQSAFAVLQRLGFAEAQAERHAVEWWIEGPSVRYEGASLGLAVALATVAAYTGVEIDPGVAVTGAVNGDQVVRAAGVGGKWQALRDSGRFQTLVLPADNVADLPAAARGDPKLRVIDVPTVEAAVLDVVGPALGLAAGRLAAVAASTADRSETKVDVRLWVEPETLTRDMRVAPAESVHNWNIGDRLRVCAQVDRDCHLAVVNIGPTGNVTVLIPNAFHPESAVRGGQVVNFPGRDDRFHFELQGPPGRERMIAIASTRPLAWGARHFDGPAPLVLAKPTTRDVAVVAQDAAGDVVGRCEIEFYVSGREAAKGPALLRGVRAEEETAELFRPLELG
jgi:class 3 adenylate cyclase